MMRLLVECQCEPKNLLSKTSDVEHVVRDSDTEVEARV
jgi:hypothetical protein